MAGTAQQVASRVDQLAEMTYEDWKKIYEANDWPSYE